MYYFYKHTHFVQKIIENTFFVVPHWYDEFGEETFFSDEGVAALASLPKLEKLELTYAINVTGHAFKNFTTLKEFKCSYVKYVVNGLWNLLETCKGIEVINISSYSTDSVGWFLASAASFLRTRNGDTPLLVYLDKYLVRVSLVRSKKDSSEKISFQIYNYTEDDDKSIITVENEPFLTIFDQHIVCKVIRKI